jgi:hypothetical protein
MRRDRLDSKGMPQVTSSSPPEYVNSGRRRAPLLPALNHQANTSVKTITGTITASMIRVAFCRIWYSLAATGPRGSRTPAMKGWFICALYGRRKICVGQV